jgi:hypothetical protein
VREASDIRQEETVKDCKQKLNKAKRRHSELDTLVKKLYEANAIGKLPDKHFDRLLGEYDEEQTGLETSIAEWQGLIDDWNTDNLKTDKFIEMVKRYTDFTELTTPMLNEFIEKVIVFEGEGRGHARRQRVDIHLNFIGAFEVPAHIVTPIEVEEQRRAEEEVAALAQRAKELQQARYEKRKAEMREHTARKRAGLLTPEEQEADRLRLEHQRAWFKEWREKKETAAPPPPPKPKQLSLKEISARKRRGLALTPEEQERYEAYRKRENEAIKKCRANKKAAALPMAANQ